MLYYVCNQEREVIKMLVLVIVAFVICVVSLCLWASCIIKDIAETLEMRKFQKQINKRWRETGKIFPD
jgi:hypothetical protein